ncbi:MAG: YkgJ family cysteine cluster protein, partial [Enterobacter sp.]|nr:YkgJ family cysteine cluster protein [Enterobacter sp.]
MTLTPAFPCNQCGACCRHVNRASETQFLDRG